AGEGLGLYPRAGGRPRRRRSLWRRGPAGRNPRGFQHHVAGQSGAGEPGVNVVATTSQVSSLQPAWRNPLVLAKAADIIAGLIALSLPWSPSLVGILNVIWIIAVVPTIDPQELAALAKRPICLFPLALFVLAVVGTLWSDAAWGVRLHAISPT